MDTVRYVFRPHGTAAIDGLLVYRNRAGEGGARVLGDRLPGDGRVLVYPAHGIVAVEGRLGALRDADADSHALAPASDLTSTAQWVGYAVGELAGAHGEVGAARLGTCEVARADLAGEIRFADGAEGLRFLAALGRMNAPRCKTVAWRKGADPQTVYWVADRTRTIKLRAYCKGTEAGTDGPGERVRVELQHRPPKAKRQAPDVFAGSDLARLYLRHLAGWVDSPAGAVPDHEALAAVLLERVERHGLTMRRAESMLGAAVLLSVGAGGRYSKHARYRRLRKLSAEGLVVHERDVEVPDVAAVPVGGYLAALRERWAA